MDVALNNLQRLICHKAKPDIIFVAFNPPVFIELGEVLTQSIVPVLLIIRTSILIFVVFNSSAFIELSKVLTRSIVIILLIIRTSVLIFLTFNSPSFFV